MKRRQFLKSGAAPLVAGLGGASLFSTLSLGHAAGAGDYKALVCLYLEGGNDGHNTLVPTDAAYNDYATARPILALPKDSLVALNGSSAGHSFGLHPALAPLAPLYNNGRLAWIANTGPLIVPATAGQVIANSVPLPPFLMSHSDQTAMQQGWGGDADASGWAGRALERFPSALVNRLNAVTMSDSRTFVLGQKTPVSFMNPGGSRYWNRADLANPQTRSGALDPLAALAENRDWTGKPIAKEDFSALNPTPGHSRAKDTATIIAKTMSEGLNWASGGTEYTKGKVSPTPDQLDYLIGQATGGVGREVSKIMQTGTAAWTGEELPPYKIPIVGRFYGSNDSQASKAALFYRNVKQLNAHEAEIKGRIKNGEDPSDYIRDNPDANMYQAGNMVERDISKMMKRKREMLKNGEDRASIKEIEAAMTERMGSFNEAVREQRSTR